MKKYIDWIVEGVVLSAMVIAFLFVVGKNRSSSIVFEGEVGTMIFFIAVFSCIMAIFLLHMKISFWDKDYDVLSVSYERDENGIPIDISIIGSEEVLQSIAEEQCILGFNIHQYLSSSDTSTYEALYGRLRGFIVIDL